MSRIQHDIIKRIPLYRTDVKVLSYVSTGLFRGRQTSERGRMQIWNPRQLEGIGPKSPQVGDPTRRRRSVATGSSTAPSLVKSISTADTSSVQTRDSVGISFQLPGLPMLVFYLEPDKPGDDSVSFLTIQSNSSSFFISSANFSIVDQKTIIKDHSCECGRKRADCIHSTIERSGELVAQRVQSEGNGDELNLTLIGVYQKPKNPDLVKKMKYVQIHFKDQSDRVKFEKLFSITKNIYKNKMTTYYEEMRREKKAWGPEHTSTLDTVNNLGNLYSDQGRMKEPEEMYVRALAGKEEAWGPNYTSTLDTVNRRAVKGMGKVPGSEHPETMTGMQNLASTWKGQGRDVEVLQAASNTSSAESVVSAVFSDDFISGSSNSGFSDQNIHSAIVHLASLLMNDEVLQPLYSTAFTSTRIGPDRFHRNFRRLLKIFSKNLIYEAKSPFQGSIAKFVSSCAKKVATIIRDKHERKDPQKLSHMRSLGSQKVEREVLDRYLRSGFQSPNVETRVMEDSQSTWPNAILADQADFDEVGNEEDMESDNTDVEEHPELTFNNLNGADTFLLMGPAFQTLRQNFSDYVHGIPQIK